MYPVVAAVLVALVVSSPLAAQPPGSDQLQGLRFRHIGPVGNRVAAVTGVAGDRTTYFAGAASGGRGAR
jgi:hypothetical protein